MQWMFFKRVYNDVPYEIIQKNNFQGKIPNEYYDRVYLCSEDLGSTAEPNKCLPIRGFVCKEFSDFEFAESEVRLLKLKYGDVRTTIIPLCKWTPRIFDAFFLNMYLKKVFWGGKIRMYRNYTK